MTTTEQPHAVYYRSGSRRPRSNREWRLHGVFPTRREADAATAEIGNRFRHLDLMITPVEASAPADPSDDGPRA